MCKAGWLGGRARLGRRVRGQGWRRGWVGMPFLRLDTTLDVDRGSPLAFPDKERVEVAAHLAEDPREHRQVIEEAHEQHRVRDEVEGVDEVHEAGKGGEKRPLRDLTVTAGHDLPEHAKEREELGLEADQSTSPLLEQQPGSGDEPLHGAVAPKEPGGGPAGARKRPAARGRCHVRTIAFEAREAWLAAVSGAPSGRPQRQAMRMCNSPQRISKVSRQSGSTSRLLRSV